MLIGVELDAITLTMGGTVVLDGVSLGVARGEMVAVVGPSGSGKTSLLRVVAGLDTPSSGRVSIGGNDVTSVPTRDRDVGFVFQDAVLYPHMKAIRNISLPLVVRSIPKDEVDRRVLAEGRALAIDHIFDRWPQQLSAGHQQLIQVARAMVRVPNVLLLDEPLARLDAATRTRLRVDLRELQQGYGVTTIYVTNDPTEAMAMGDRIAVIDRGRLVQTGSPMDVYQRPDTRFVAELMGERPMNFLAARVVADAEGSWVLGDGFRLRAWALELASLVDQDVVVGVRPEDIVADASGVVVTPGRTVPFGSHDEVELLVGAGTLWMWAAPGERPSAVRFSRWHVFDDAGNAIAHLD